MLQRSKIHHLKALNVDKIILEGKSHNTIWDSSGALFVKSVLFRKKGHGKSLRLQRHCPSRILLSTILAKKLGIMGLCTICSF